MNIYTSEAFKRRLPPTQQPPLALHGTSREQRLSRKTKQSCSTAIGNKKYVSYAGWTHIWKSWHVFMVNRDMPILHMLIYFMFLKRPQRMDHSVFMLAVRAWLPAPLHRSASFHLYNLNSMTHAEENASNAVYITFRLAGFCRRRSSPNVYLLHCILREREREREKIHIEVKCSGQKKGEKEASKVTSFISPNASFFQRGHLGRGLDLIWINTTGVCVSQRRPLLVLSGCAATLAAFPWQFFFAR